MAKVFKLNGEISDFDYHSDFYDFTSAKTVKAFVDSLKEGEKATIEINSVGGLVTEGVAMANAIKNSKAEITAHVTGLAASMASVVACACQKLVFDEASFFMIHNPWGFAIGNADELRHEASVLDTMKKACLSFYRGKFSGTEEDLAKLMDAETWYTGKECQENGFACEVTPSDMKAAAAFSSKNFANVPEGAKAFLNVHEMTDEEKAKIEAVRKAALEPAKPADDWEARFKGASKKINELQDTIAARDARIAELEKASATPSEDLSAVTAERDTLKGERDALKGEVENLKAQGEQSSKELATAAAEVNSLKAKLAESDKALADVRQQLDHVNQTRAILTGGVLTPSTEGSSYAEKMAKAKKPEEREALRKAKLEGKIK